MDYNSIDAEIETLGEPQILSPISREGKSAKSQCLYTINTNQKIGL